MSSSLNCVVPLALVPPNRCNGAEGVELPIPILPSDFITSLSVVPFVPIFILSLPIDSVNLSSSSSFIVNLHSSPRFKLAIASSVVVLAAYMVINFILKPYFSPLDNNIVDKIITFEAEGSEMQLMFSSDGKIVGVEDDSLVENPNVTYEVKGKKVSVYAEDGEITVFLFSSKNPKAGDPLVMGNDAYTVKATIVNIESREDKKLVNHTLIKQQHSLGGLYHIFFSLYGSKDLKKQFPYEEEIFEESRFGETLKKHPTAGKIKPVLYNHLSKWDANSIILATPWVIDGHRVVAFGDGSRQIVDEKKYQKLIQQKGVEMKPILPLNSIDLPSHN